MKRDILCALSGGGFRATFFHAGVLRGLIRLGLKDDIKVISSVSGGSIINALFGIYYDKIKSVEDFDAMVLCPLSEFSNMNPRKQLIIHRAKSTVQSAIAGVGSLLGSVGRPLASFASKLNSDLFMEKLDEHLFKGKTLADLSENVRVVINATNLNNGARFRFDNSDFGDYKLGYSRETHSVPISQAVMSSACYPLMFSPIKLELGQYRFYLRDKSKKDTVQSNTPDTVYLADGGIYDNLGYYSIKSELDRGRNGFVIISDAANRFRNTGKEYSFANSLLRVSDILMEQVSNRDRSKIMASLESGEWVGSYFKLENNCRCYREYDDSKATCPTDVPNIGWSDSVVSRIADIRTDLDTFSEQEVKCLVYHGESVVETILAKWHKSEYQKMIQNPMYHLPSLPIDSEASACEYLKKSSQRKLL